jgi:uncharacterized membrane protein YphA (DoxX/SURF4 family)
MVTQVKPPPSQSSSASGKPLPVSSASSKGLVLAPWRARGIAFLRILFGVVWGIDAWFKFQPDFINNFTTYLTTDGQPGWVSGWINFWINVVKVDPHVFAHLVAFGELAIAIALILGAFSNLTAVGGILLSIVIWTTAEGFGGPYVAGSTDIGAAIIYVLVFVGLFLAMAGMTFGLDRFITPKLGPLGFLASSGAQSKVK